MFETDLINSQTGRYVVVAESVLPIIMLIVLAYFWGAKLQTNTKIPKIAMIVVWTILTLLWFLALLISAFNFDSTGLVVYAVFSLITMLVCVLWAWLFVSGKTQWATGLLMLLVFLTFWLWNTAMTTGSALDTYAPLTVGFFTSPLAVWSLISLFTIQ